MKQQFIEDISDTLRCTVYDGNRPIVPTSATVTLYTPSGSVLQAAAAATVSSTTGEMTYTLSTTHTADNDLNYKAVWAYVYNGTTYYQTQLFDIVLSLLAIPIIDDDLFNELEALRQINLQSSGTTTSGGAGMIADTTRRKETDDYWKGGTAKIIAGTGIGQERDITGFTQSTGQATVTPNWATNPDTTSVYVFVKSFTAKIEAAFTTICTMLYDKGKRHELILESSQIALPLTYLAIHMIALDQMDDEGDKWDRIQKLYQEKFDKAFNNMKLDYDEDESGLVDGSETQQSQTSLRIGRS